jgi:hypothetical protein
LPGVIDGDRSSMVELQIVVLAVAGSSPVGHPLSCRLLHHKTRRRLVLLSTLF